MTDQLSDLSLGALAPRVVRRQLAIPFFFFLLGLLYASWVARIPAIRDHLHLDTATLSMVLLCCGIGGVGSFPLAAWLNAHYGARRTAWYTGLILLLSLPGLGYVSCPPALMLLGMVFGAASSCFDVAINTLGIAVASFGVTPLWHFLASSVLLSVPLCWSCKALPDDCPAPDPERRIFAIPQGHLAVLGLIVFCCAIVEGSIADWSGLYMKDHMGADDGGAPLAYAAFAGMMLLARLVGDRFKERWGARRIVVWGALLASAS
ncbi:MAG: MFS transporter, partial [Herbaspirillum sp.]